MTFNFRELQKKFNKKTNKKVQQDSKGEKLTLFQDFQVNPLVIQQCKKIQTQYVKFYNNNRYFYLHADPSQINTIQKVKEDQFNKIRKESEICLYNEKGANEQSKLAADSPKKKPNRTNKQTKFRQNAYLFRKNIKIIQQKLKKLKLTVKDIIQKDLFSDQPYRYGKDVFEAIKSGQQTKLWRCYIQNKFVIYSVDSTRKTLLVWACIRGFHNLLQMLLQMGSLVNKKDLLGHSALYYAIYYKQENCVKLLLLNQVLLTSKDIELANQDKKIKNIVQLYLSTMGSIQKMQYRKRVEFFQERLKHIT